MFPSDVIWGFFSIAQICVGLMGNSLFFTLYMYTFLTQSYLKRPMDLVFTHLTLVYVLTIMFRLIPDTMSSLGARHFLDDVACKATMYTYRVTRGLSICTTSLLSVFQAITISPSNSKWAWLKPKISTCVFPSFLFFWIIKMLLYTNVIKELIASTNVTNVSSVYSLVYCQTKQLKPNYSRIFISAMIFHDVFFVFLMMSFSIYVVNLLYKHRQRSQHVHSPSLSSHLSPEIKATHTTLLLVNCFVFCYFSNNITLYLLCKPEKNPRLERIPGIISSCYPTICPFMLMKNHKIISKFTSSLSRMRIIFFSQRTLSR
ncbi:LOW QUALITY PROTEIN: vomeronasal type-1 receptor 2-like [Hipposideros larvatus]